MAKVTKAEQKELLKKCLERNKELLEILSKGDREKGIDSLKVIANIKGKIEMLGDILQMLNGNAMMIKLEAGL